MCCTKYMGIHVQVQHLFVLPGYLRLSTASHTHKVTSAKPVILGKQMSFTGFQMSFTGFPNELYRIPNELYRFPINNIRLLQSSIMSTRRIHWCIYESTCPTGLISTYNAGNIQPLSRITRFKNCRFNGITVDAMISKHQWRDNPNMTWNMDYYYALFESWYILIAIDNQ